MGFWEEKKRRGLDDDLSFYLMWAELAGMFIKECGLTLNMGRDEGSEEVIWSVWHLPKHRIQ